MYQFNQVLIYIERDDFLALVACKDCGRYFNGNIKQHYCKRCREKQENLLKLNIKEFVKEHNIEDPKEIAQELEIDEEFVSKFLIKEIPQEIDEKIITCRRCSKIIEEKSHLGEFCEECTIELNKDLVSMLEYFETKKKSGYHSR